MSSITVQPRSLLLADMSTTANDTLLILVSYSLLTSSPPLSQERRVGFRIAHLMILGIGCLVQGHILVLVHMAVPISQHLYGL